MVRYSSMKINTHAYLHDDAIELRIIENNVESQFIMMMVVGGVLMFIALLM